MKAFRFSYEPYHTILLMNANKNWPPDKIYDFLIIGSEMGGSSIAHALHFSGASILMVERGDFIKQEKENWY